MPALDTSYRLKFAHVGTTPDGIKIYEALVSGQRAGVSFYEIKRFAADIWVVYRKDIDGTKLVRVDVAKTKTVAVRYAELDLARIKAGLEDLPTNRALKSEAATDVNGQPLPDWVYEQAAARKAAGHQMRGLITIIPNEYADNPEVWAARNGLV